MKISELIEELKKIQEVVGDVDVRSGDKTSTKSRGYSSVVAVRKHPCFPSMSDIVYIVNEDNISEWGK